MSPPMTVGEFALATGLSAKAHAAELRRRRDLEDRALALAAAGVYAAPDPDDDGGRERDSPDPALGAGVLEESDLRVAAVGRGEAPVPPGTPQADDHERAADHEGQ